MTLTHHLRAALTAAMKARDPVAMRALRSALGALDNAQAVELSHAPTSQPGVIAGGVAGLGTGDVARKQLSFEEQLAVLHAEIAERRALADRYDGLGQLEEASRLRAEAAVLESASQSARRSSSDSPP
jgi:hypothetical protein